MATSATPSLTTVTRRGQSKLDEQLDEMLDQRDQYVRVIAAATEVRDAAIAEAIQVFEEAVADAPTQLKQLDKRLGDFVERFHYPLTRRHSKTIKRDKGEVKVILQRRSLDLPASEAAVIEALLSVPRGKKYLVLKYQLDKRALLSAPGTLLMKLRSRGVWVGKHREVQVRSISEAKGKTIATRRFNERTR
jgi:hypothetical protein